MPAPIGNQFAIGNNGGRPPHFESPEALEKMINEYFNHPSHEFITIGETTFQKEPITITGLALYLGFESRTSFYDYEKHEEFSYIIKKARLKVESEYEAKLSRNNPTGSIFALKNMGWKDTSEIKHHIPKGILNIDPLDDDKADEGIAENSPA